jgi:hypothetical protein
VSIHCLDCSLVSTFSNEIHVSSPVTCMMWLKNSSSALWYRSKKVKAKPFFALCVHLWAFSEPVSHRTCGSLA